MQLSPRIYKCNIAIYALSIAYFGKTKPLKHSGDIPEIL
jgi:hypothetical protein